MRKDDVCLECDFDYTCPSCMCPAPEEEEQGEPCEVITVDFINKKRVA